MTEAEVGCSTGINVRMGECFEDLSHCDAAKGGRSQESLAE